MVIRDMKPEDIAAGVQLCRASGWNQVESDWSLFLALSPAGCRVAEKNDEVVGTVATIRYQNRFSWLAMVLVDPRERRNGIGTRLLCEGLSLLGTETCVRLDATAAGRRIYRQHGFVDEYPITRFTTSAGYTDIDPPVESVRRMREQDLPEVFDQDRLIFGADRELVLRSLFERSPECAWVAGGSNIQGYCFGRPGFLYQQLGPIVARDKSVARDLVSQCLIQRGGPRFVIDAPLHCATWISWLRSSGFAEERSFTRMRRGENRYPGKTELVFGVVGPEFG
ncbi:MAG: GNAT family N-acetyltransferase [Acidobacteriaceae bacterium]|nr:GNAT family N-acetyltransferase [Acidobacteriaceae bacterium]